MHLHWRGQICPKGGGGRGLLSDVMFCLQADGPITGARGGGAYQWGGVKAAVYDNFL